MGRDSCVLPGTCWRLKPRLWAPLTLRRKARLRGLIRRTVQGRSNAQRFSDGDGRRGELPNRSPVGVRLQAPLPGRGGGVGEGAVALTISGYRCTRKQPAFAPSVLTRRSW